MVRVCQQIVRKGQESLGMVNTGQVLDHRPSIGQGWSDSVRIGRVDENGAGLNVSIREWGGWMIYF